MAKTSSAVTVGWLLLVTVLLSISTADPVQAAASKPLGGSVTFIGSPPSTLCAGATTKIVVSYLAYGKKGVPAPPPNAIGTLTATTTLRGDSATAKAPFPSGNININYMSTEAGKETMVATLMYADYAPIKSTPLSFTVQKCDYYFSIRAHAVVETDYGLADEFYIGEGWLSVDENGAVSGTIPIDWQFTLKADDPEVGCILVPMPTLETSMTVKGTMETVDRYFFETHYLNLEFAYDELKIPSANVKCVKTKTNIPFSIPSVNPVVALRKAWDPRTGTGSRLTTQTDGFGPGKVVFAVAERIR